MPAPTEDPALDFFQAAEVHGKLKFAAGKRPEFLGGMPFALGDETGGERIEMNADTVFGAAFEDAETIAEMGGDGEIGGAPETGLGVARAAHARQGEGADLAPCEVKPKEVPLVLDAAEMIGLDAPAFVPGASELFVFELQLVGVEEGAADGFEDLDVGHGRADAAEGDGGIDVAPMEPDPVFQAVGDLLKGGLEPLFKGGAAVLFEGFLSDEKGDDFTFGDVDAGKARDGFSVDETEMELVVLDGHAHAVPHEIDVALDGLAGDFQLFGELSAIWKLTGFDLLVELPHAHERRPGI